jgi:hypothetical protein
MTKGIVIFYVNVNAEHLEHVKPQELIDMTRENHVETITSLKGDGWDIIFMPCIGEASRVEKVDLMDIEEKPSDD